jgi:hypothetical protein
VALFITDFYLAKTSEMDRERERQTDRETDRQRDREMEKERVGKHRNVNIEDIHIDGG